MLFFDFFFDPPPKWFSHQGALWAENKKNVGYLGFILGLIYRFSFDVHRSGAGGHSSSGVQCSGFFLIFFSLCYFWMDLSLYAFFTGEEDEEDQELAFLFCLVNDLWFLFSLR